MARRRVNIYNITPILIIMIIITLSLKWYSGKLKTDFLKIVR